MHSTSETPFAANVSSVIGLDHLTFTDDDFQQAERFLQRLTGTDPSTTAFWFQTFDDGPESRKELAKKLHGTLREHWSELQRFQRHGAGVFVTINESHGGRLKDQVVRIRAVWRDVDTGTAPGLPLEEQMRVATPGGFHSYLLTDAGPEQFDAWAGVMRTMVARYGADNNAKDLARVLRVPGFWHLKGAPVKIVIDHLSDRARYTWAEITAALGRDQDARADAPAADTSDWIDNAPGRLDLAEAERLIITGESLHGPLASLASHYAATALDIDSADRILSELMDRSAAKNDPDRAERWKTEKAKLRNDTLLTAYKKFGDTYGTKVDFTDRGNANLLAQLTTGDLRYVVERKVWIVWVNRRWEVDATREHSFAATGRVGEHYSREVARLTAQMRGMDSAAAKRHQKTIEAVGAWEKACRGRRGIENMLALAAMHPVFVIAEAALDTDPYLLGVQNGVVDLRTGALRPDAREDFVTRRCAYAYRTDATAPRWVKFVDEVTGYPIEALSDTDGEVVPGTVGRYTARPGFADYLQRALGYSCSGVTEQHKLFVTFGEHGSNGKNVTFDTVKSVLGDYATTASEKLLLAGRRETDANSATPALVALKGSRLAVSSEPPANSTFDSSVLKALTGEVRIAGRALNQGAGEIAVTWHLWLLCNAKPKVEHLEQAVVGRILMLPFDRRWNRPGVAEHDPSLPDPDLTLPTVFAAEGEGILRWLVHGAVRYFAEGLAPCAEVTAATRSYFDAQRVDPVETWLAGQVRCPTAAGAQAKAAFDAFNAWRVAQETAGLLEGGMAPSNPNAFGRAMKRLGVAPQKHGVMRYGIRLADDFAAADVPAWAFDIA